MCVQVVKGCLGFSSLSDRIKNPKIRLLIGSLEILMNCCLLYFLFCFFLERPTASWGGGNVCFPAKRNTLDISFYFLFVFFSLSFPFSFEKLIVLICSSPMTWLRAESDHSSSNEDSSSPFIMWRLSRNSQSRPWLADCPAMSLIFGCWHSRKWQPPICSGLLYYFAVLDMVRTVSSRTR